MADPNLDPNELGQNAKIASNGLVYRPPSDAILQRYMDKFAKKNAGGEMVLEYSLEDEFQTA